MNLDQEHDRQLDDLQHEAEHTRPPKKGSVMGYLAILFAAAFLLLLMSYFMQQRTNQEAMNDLQQSSSSAVQSLDNLIAERNSLKEQVASLEETQRDLQTEAEALRSELGQAREAAAAAQRQTEALNQLNQVRILYNQHRNREARELLAQCPNLEEELTRISSALTEEERAIYDPLEAFQSFMEWLG